VTELALSLFRINMTELKNIHRPLHIYVSGQIYFITASTYNKLKILDDGRKRLIVRNNIIYSAIKWKIKVFAWVILSNHYHVLFQADKGEDISAFIRTVNSKSSIELNRLNQTPNRMNFYQYWDRCVRDEKDFYIKFNYIHYNPVHHDYVKNPKDYLFSSYNEYVNQYGESWLYECLKANGLNEMRYLGRI